jgi:hypothetical protein
VGPIEGVMHATIVNFNFSTNRSLRGDLTVHGQSLITRILVLMGTNLLTDLQKHGGQHAEESNSSE